MWELSFPRRPVSPPPQKLPKFSFVTVFPTKVKMKKESWGNLFAKLPGFNMEYFETRTLVDGTPRVVTVGRVGGRVWLGSELMAHCPGGAINALRESGLFVALDSRGQVRYVLSALLRMARWPVPVTRTLDKRGFTRQVWSRLLRSPLCFSRLASIVLSRLARSCARRPMSVFRGRADLTPALPP